MREIGRDDDAAAATFSFKSSWLIGDSVRVPASIPSVLIVSSALNSSLFSERE